MLRRNFEIASFFMLTNGKKLERVLKANKDQEVAI